MKTFGKIVICILVILAAIGVSYLLYNGGNENKNDPSKVSGTAQNNTNDESNKTNNSDKNNEYVGIEENTEGENQEEPKEDETKTEEPEVELTGKDKAVDIVKKQYAMEGQTVRFDHMEGTDYIIKINDGTAVTWYLVDATTWEAEEY